MSEVKAVIAYCTVPNVATGKKIAKTVVEEGLCACVNLIPGITSFFIYEGEFGEESEELLIIKTDVAHFSVLKERITQLHPYEVPEIIAAEVADGNEAYLKWLGDALKPL